ncbi:MAG: N-6 DNA methylase [Deltaproteobacteria bacterium]|nr:N-6 DNA methylase [Deltaproteobacteria bacterium]
MDTNGKTLDVPTLETWLWKADDALRNNMTATADKHIMRDRITHSNGFDNDSFPDIKADVIPANPPFNASHRRSELLREDMHRQYGVPCLFQMQAHASDGCTPGLGT